MNILDIIQRNPRPAAWEEGDNIPWNEPGFSRRMLAEHLSQEHDAASRRSALIERQVAWVHSQLLAGQPSQILDLGCGPGLYTSRFARLGHTCTGIDYSPASIAYASQFTRQEALTCRYIQEDIRSANYGEGYDLIMLIFGEFNIFNRAHARSILTSIHQALAPGGRILLEPHTEAAVRQIGNLSPEWSCARQGLFADSPYVCLRENFWEDQSRTATCRYFIIDAETGQVSRLAQSFQAYSDEEYRENLTQAGFREIIFYAGLEGNFHPPAEGLLAISGIKG